MIDMSVLGAVLVGAVVGSGIGWLGLWVFQGWWADKE